MAEELKLNGYETIMILNPDLTEENIESAIKEYVHHIIHGDILAGKIPAFVHKIDKIGKKKLAYDVKDKSEGWYIQFIYRTQPERIIQLEKFLRNDDNVLKFITVKMDEEAVAEIDLDQVISEQPGDTDATPAKKEVDAFDLIFGI